MAMKHYLVNNKNISVEILEQLPSFFKLKINDKIFEVSLEKYDPEEKLLSILINSHPVKIRYSDLIFIINSCTQVHVEQVGEKPVAKKCPLDNSTIKSPLTGRVIKILVKQGDEIKKDQTLLIIESMKMENEIRAISGGIIKNILISEGNLVQQNQDLISF
jgi:biotin carboxyl carrier protein